MIEQLQLLVRQLTTSQKIGIVFGALASAFVLIVFVMWAGRPDMQPAFTSLRASDAAAISSALRTAKISFQVADAGSTILVPATSLSDARVAAAAAGVSTDSSTQGFSLFDKSGFGMSAFDQQVTYQRALEGKLTQTIEAMSGVDTTTISIVAAQNSVFASQSQPASASVVVKMRSGQPPDTGMVRAIVATVAGAVAGLTPDNVTVVDSSGRQLAGPQTDLTSDALTTQQAVERQLSARVQEMADQVLGPGHASVVVSATLDMDKVDQTITTVAPITQGNWTPTSVQTVNERYAGTGTGSSGIPGVSSNVPGLPTYPGATLPLPSAVANASPGASPAASAAPAASGSPSATPSASPSTSEVGGYIKTQETVNYNNSQTVSRIITQPGAIRRLSVAVLVDQAALGSTSADGLKQAVTAAIGADVSRGDVVSVTAVAFASHSPAVAASPISSDLTGTISGLASTVFGGLIALAFLFLVWRNVRALRYRADEMQMVTVSSGQQALLSGYTATGARGALADVAELESSPQAKIQERLRMVAEEKPDALVGLMNGWLREGDQR